MRAVSASGVLEATHDKFVAQADVPKLLCVFPSSILLHLSIYSNTAFQTIVAVPRD